MGRGRTQIQCRSYFKHGVPYLQPEPARRRAEAVDRGACGGTRCTVERMGTVQMPNPVHGLRTPPAGSG
jgi:hypothetical protein